MIEQQKMIEISIPELESSVKTMKETGYRLVQIGATTIADGFEVNYSFDKEYHFVNFRVKLAQDQAALPSVSAIYWNAFLYENEIQDLFGIRISGMAVDYHGQFYKTTVKVPFGIVKKQEKSAENNG
jgi:ech hydrogenase subunit D